MPRIPATSPADLPDRAVILARTGLAFVEDMIAGRLPPPPIGVALGFAPTEAARGRAVFEGAARFDAMNPMGGVHGGWYGAILDSCMGCAVMTDLAQGELYTTLDFSVNITRALPLGIPVRAVGEVQHRGRSTAVARGELRGRDDDRLYATGTTTCLVMRPEEG
jgi:uncharacterized protein (TIGR00369 family)